MTEVFLKIVNRNISAGWLVLAVLVLRFALKKAPKWVSVLLWGIVAVRLICPFSIESALSLIPSTQTFPEEIISGPDFNIQSGIPPVDQQINDYLDDHYFEGVTVPTNHGANVMSVLTVIWLVGMVILIAYTVVTYLRLRRNLSMATILQENIFQCETVRSPFVLGILKPRIYLPYGMDGNDLHHVVAHEQAHIRRKDHWWKPLGFLLLTVYWFNPLMWVAYILLCRDIELACDEKVIAQLGNEQRADYTQALVACSVNRRMIAACPLAFGEVGVKDRVKSILNYRKPTFWVIVTALVLSAVVAVCFLTDPNPSREFAMKGKNVTSLEPEAIVERILDVEDWESSNVYVNADNFDVTVDSDFNWVYSQAVRYFFTDAKHTYSAQLRIFTEDGKYFLTEPIEWVEEEREFLLRYYLEALKYLPQDEIRQMAPADQYSIYLVDFQDAESNDQRTITYSKENGVGDIDGWYIHLRVEPLHAEADGQGYHGYGSEVIDLYYGDGNLSDNLPIFGGELHLGLNAEIIEIDYEYEIMAVKDIDENANVFGDRCLIDCSWASARYNLMYVDYSQYNNIQTIGFEDFQVGDQVIIGLYDNQKQTAYNGTAVATQVQLATQRMNIDSPAHVDLLEDAISRAILEHFAGDDPDGLIHAESHVVLSNEMVSGTPLVGSGDHVQMLKVYMLVHHAKYSTYGGTLEAVGGSYGAAAITFAITDYGEYVLQEYWEPRDGEFYSKDIRDFFPKYAAEAILNDETQAYMKALKEETYRKAQSYFSGTMGLDERIAALMKEIQSSPLHSSNPGDYIRTHEAEYKELVSYGEYTLRYCFTEFLKGSQIDLCGHIMSQACQEIMLAWGEGYTMDGYLMTGQDWFDEFSANVRTLHDQMNPEELRKHYPGAYLLLEMTEANLETKN